MDNEDSLQTDSEPAHEEAVSQEADMKSENYVYDIVILHGDQEEGLAELVRDNFRKVQGADGRSLRVEIFRDIVHHGQQPMSALDLTLEHSRFVAFFRTETFANDNFNGFAVYTSFNDRVYKGEYSVLPIDVTQQVRLRGKATFNSGKGILVDKNGELTPRVADMLRKTYLNKLKKEQSTAPESDAFISDVSRLNLREAGPASPSESLGDGGGPNQAGTEEVVGDAGKGINTYYVSGFE